MQARPLRLRILTRPAQMLPLSGAAPLARNLANRLWVYGLASACSAASPRIIRPEPNSAGAGLHLAEHLHGDGAEIFAHACKLGCEGIVSKRGSRYVSGRTDNWIKVKNPTAPAVRREAEEDWGKARWR